MTITQTESAQELRWRAEELLRAIEDMTREPTTPEEMQKILHELRVHQIELETQNEELRRAYEELDTSQDRYFSLYDLAPVGYLTLSEKNMIREVNLAAANMFGVARKSLIREPISRLLPTMEVMSENPDQNIFYQHLKQCLETSTPQVWEMQMKRNDGELFWVHLSISPAQNGECWITLDDISERKKQEAEKLLLEQQFQQAQKLESLGVMAGGIAHDFNNILAIIMGYCSLIKMDYGMAEKNIPPIEKAVERAAALCRQMLAYAEKTEYVQNDVNIGELVYEMVKTLKATIAQNVVIKLGLSSDIPLIKADASQIGQVVMNLIINASEAIGEVQGEILISLTKSLLKADKSNKDHLGKIIPAGNYVCLEVIDSGCGMDDDTKRRLFEPFYTTKFTGRGLGMSAVLGIIKAHKGALQVSSITGLGSTFKVYLPVLETNPVVHQSQLQGALSESWRGSGTILLVEDEEQVLLIAKAMLEELGFAVIEAVNGKEALELYQKKSTEITLVMTDIGMPVMDGYALFSELKTLNPKLPIIISSGYGDKVVTSRISFDGIAGLLSKPYSFNKLREVMRGLVEGAG
ncbi:MAG: response regulator [Deltaproteobacteria bacterium]